MGRVQVEPTRAQPMNVADAEQPIGPETRLSLDRRSR
jgi:hypothetical protein